MMGVGKCSPTVSAAYDTQSDWHKKLQIVAEREGLKFLVDDEGYDPYGYHIDTEKDRAGWTEWDYLSTFETDGNIFNHTLYEHVYQEWTFDGVRPVRRK